MTIRVEINGEIASGLKEVNVNKSMETIASTFSLLTSSLPTDTFPIRVNDRCDIFVNDQQVIGGFIDSVEMIYQNDSHELLFQGRDKTSDIADSTLPGSVIYTTPISLKTVCERIISLLGADIDVIEEVDIEDLDQDVVVQAGVGERAFDFLERYARKRQVLISSNGEGNLVLTRSSEEEIESILLNKINGASNNILSGRLLLNNQDRYYSYSIDSQGSPAYFEILKSKGYDDPEALVFKRRTSIDAKMERRRSKILSMVAESSLTLPEAEQRVIWENNIRRARSKAFAVTVQGYTPVGLDEIWEPNKLISVVDDFADIDDTLLISSVSYSLSANATEGSRTVLNLLPKDAFKPEPNQSKTDDNTGNYSGAYVNEDLDEFF